MRAGGFSPIPSGVTAIKNPQMVSVEDYLSDEELSEIKHEYLGGTELSLEEIYEGVDFA